MKTVSVAVDDAVYDNVEALAGKLNMSVSALVLEYLASLTRAGRQSEGGSPGAQTEAVRDRLERLELVEALTRCNLVLGYKPGREKTYER